MGTKVLHWVFSFSVLSGTMVRQRMSQILEIWRDEGGGSWIRRDVYPASGLRSRQSQIKVHTTDNKENIPSPGTRVRLRTPLPHWYPRTPLRDVTVVVHALERRRKRLRAAAAAAQWRNTTNPEESSSISSSRSPVTPEMNASVHSTPDCQEVNLTSFHDASPSITASPSSCISASTPLHNLCSVYHPPKEEDDRNTAKFESKLERTIVEMEKLLVLNNSNKAPPASKVGTRVLMSMR